MKTEAFYFLRENKWLPTQGGWGNGYVMIPPNHPLFEVNYTDIEGIDVHGGLSFGERYLDFWVIGFDTLHFGDNQERWTKERVLQETLRLKDQIENYQHR